MVEFQHHVRLARAQRAMVAEARVIRALHACSEPDQREPEWFGATLGESLFLAARRLEWTFDLGLGALGYEEEA